MTMWGIVTAGILALAATSAEARDRWTGQWGGNCESGTQCWIDISSTRAGYMIGWVVADRMDATKVLCRIDATAPKDSKRLSGTASDGQAITLVLVGGGSSIKADGIASVPCAGMLQPLAGAYSAIGD